MTLAVFAIISLLLFSLVGALGWHYAKSKFWKFADVLYYPLAALGLFLFFASFETKRDLISLEEIQTTLNQDLLHLEEHRPTITKFSFDKKYVHSLGEVLTSILDLHRNCKQNKGLNPACVSASEIAPALKNYEVTLLTYSGPEDLDKVCNSASEMLSRLLNRNVVSDVLVASLAELFEKGLIGKISSDQYTHPAKFEQKVRRQLKLAIYRVFARHSKNMIEYNPLKMMLDIDAAILNRVAMSFPLCFQAPRSVRNGELSLWNNRISNKKTAIADLNSQITKVRKKLEGVNGAEVFRITWFPFLIIIALSIKFGKAVSGVSKKK